MSHATAFTRREVEEAETLACRLVCAFPNLDVVPRSSFKLAKSFAAKTKDHLKKTTVRYAPGAIEYPEDVTLPVFVARQSGEGFEEFGYAHIVALCYKEFANLDAADALRDGFDSEVELKNQLRLFYGPIGDEEIVCIFSFAFERQSSPASLQKRSSDRQGRLACL